MRCFFREMGTLSELVACREQDRTASPSLLSPRLEPCRSAFPVMSHSGSGSFLANLSGAKIVLELLSGGRDGNLLKTVQLTLLRRKMGREAHEV